MRIGLWKPSYLVQSCCYELLCSIQIPRTKSRFAWWRKFCQPFKKYQTTSGFNAHNPLQEDVEYIFGNQGHYGIINAAASMLLGSKTVFYWIYFSHRHLSSVKIRVKENIFWHQDTAPLLRGRAQGHSDLWTTRTAWANRDRQASAFIILVPNPACVKSPTQTSTRIIKVRLVSPFECNIMPVRLTQEADFFFQT